MDLSWEKVPPHILQRLLGNFNIRELKTYSKVCKNWLLAIDKLWKEKIVLYSGKIDEEDIDLLAKSKRYFVNINLQGDSGIDNIRKILKILKERENGDKDIYIKRLDLCFIPNISDVFDVLQSVGKSVESLYVSLGLLGSACAKYTGDQEYSFQNLASVQELMVYKLTPDFERVSKYMTNLKIVDLESTDFGSFSVLESILQDNCKSLRTLVARFTPENEPYSADEVMLRRQSIISSLRNCKALDTLDLSCLRFGDLEMNILQELTELKNLRLDMPDNLETVSVESFQKLFDLKTLSKLELEQFDYTKEHIKRGLQANIPNLQALYLRGVFFDDELGILLAKNVPNLKELHIISIKTGKLTFRFIQEAADNLKHLEILEVQSDFLTSTDILKNNALTTTPFDNLKALILNNTKVNEKFLKEIKAPRLKKLDLSHCEELTDFTLTVICDNFPNLEHLDFYFSKGFTDVGVHELSTRLRFLNNISIYGCNSLTWESVKSIILNCKSLREADCSELFERDDDDSFETELKRINDLRSPPLRFNKKYAFEDEDNGRFCKYKLISDTVCVRFTNFRKI